MFKKVISCSFIFYMVLGLCAAQSKTKYIIVLVVDGPRYSETWGDSTKQYIPHMEEMAKYGSVSTNFYNDKFTYTSAGHTAITTGHYQELENRVGTQLPDYPSYLQYYIKKTKSDSTKTRIITSKDKLAILGNTKNTEWHNRYRPSTDCGLAGLGTGYREDTTTFHHILKTMKTEHPHLVFVNFKEPDYSGHKKDWQGYLKGIKDTDSFVYEIWKYIQEDPFYKDKTTLFVTNDHGRHIDGHKQGFAEHGDLCIGCKHINFYAFGPDIKRDYISTDYHNQTDITATIAQLLKLKMPYSEGKVMKDIFK